MMAFNKIKFGQRLREFRKIRGLTQSELASLLNTTQGNIGHIENGRRGPGADFLTNLYLTFRESFEYLLLGSEEEAPSDSAQHPEKEAPVHTLVRRARTIDPHSRLLPPLISLLEAVEETVNTLNRTAGPDTHPTDPETPRQ